MKVSIAQGVEGLLDRLSFGLFILFISALINVNGLIANIHSIFGGC